MTGTLRLIVLIITALYLGLNMSQASAPDPSMLILRATNPNLVSEKIAISLARKLIEEVYGHDELKAQEPLKIQDGGGTWKVEGSRQFDDKPSAENLPDYGRVELVVSKADCQILKFTREMMLIPPR